MVIKITPQQAKRVNALLRKLCANYDGGNCLLLDGGKRCVLCHQPFAPRAKNQRYCPACAAKQKRLKATERQRRKRASASRF